MSEYMKPLKENKNNALLIQEMGEKIQYSAGLLKDLFEHEFVGSFRSDSRGNIIMANRLFSEFLGFRSTKDMLDSAKHIKDLFVDSEDTEWFINELQTKGYVDSFVTQVRFRNGNTVWVSSKGIKNDSQKEVYDYFITDITKLRKRNDFGTDRQKPLLKYVDTTTDILLVLNQEAKIVDANRQACSRLAYDREELCEMTMFDLDQQLKKEEFELRPKHLFFERGQFITFESIFKQKNGKLFPAQVRLGRLDLIGQKIFIALLSDITERQKAENELRDAIKDIKKMQHILEKQNMQLREKIDSYHKHEEIIGRSNAIKNVLYNGEKVAYGDTCVLILGETGTGKELLASAIHNMSSRKDRVMVKVNCAALPGTLIESELFGREKGAFTGAVNKQIGRFEAAHKSTIFLDEIGDLSLELQAKLLRVLQDGKFERLGSSKTFSVDVRVIAATNHDLSKRVEENKFRKDLYYRLNVFPITIPPLRERREDIPLLVWSFVEELSQSLGKYIKTISKKDMARLKNNYWAGNVRELKNTIERAMILASDTTLKFDWIDSSPEASNQPQKLEDLERSHIISVLERTGWRIRGAGGASELLGIKPNTLDSRMKKLGIERPTKKVRNI